MLTRRDLICSSAVLLGSSLARRAAGQPVASAVSTLSLAYGLPNTYLEAVSPDGSKLCISDWQKPYQTFVWPNWPWRRNNAIKNHDPLRVLELGTWKTIYSGHLRAPVAWSSFFADSQALFTQTSSFPMRQLAVVDLNTGVFTERMDTAILGRLRLMEATTGRTLLMEDFNTTNHQTEALVQLDLPDYRERMRTPFATQPRMAKSSELGGISFSADRKILACAFDDVLVCRRTDDLGILWTRRIDPNLAGVDGLACSADGSIVAASVSDHLRPPRQFYIAFYDGKSGADVISRPLCGSYAMAVSPDGRLIAIGEIRDVTIRVHLYSLPSGSLVTSVIHGEAAKGRHQFLSLGFVKHGRGIVFTPDGKYLITSAGTGTKVWRLG